MSTNCTVIIVNGESGFVAHLLCQDESEVSDVVLQGGVAQVVYQQALEAISGKEQWCISKHYMLSQVSGNGVSASLYTISGKEQ